MGFSLIELLFALGLFATVGGLAIPQFLTSLDDARVSGAARYVAARLQSTRMEAIARNAVAALRIDRSSGAYIVTSYVDGNGNGVLAGDIRSGVDRAIRPPERLPDHFPGVDFGTTPGLPAVDPSGTAPGADPIRLGSGDGVSFAALGTATSGSLYILGRRRAQYVVRIFGETGRVRILKFNSRTGQWIPLQDA